MNLDGELITSSMTEHAYEKVGVNNEREKRDYCDGGESPTRNDF